jgi:uncharacterized membrane protein YhfC
MIDDEKIKAIALLLVLTAMLIGTCWWLPQKWQGCQSIYENRPAQIVCFLSK